MLLNASDGLQRSFRSIRIGVFAVCSLTMIGACGGNSAEAEVEETAAASTHRPSAPAAPVAGAVFDAESARLAEARRVAEARSKRMALLNGHWQLFDERRGDEQVDLVLHDSGRETGEYVGRGSGSFTVGTAATSTFSYEVDARERITLLTSGKATTRWEIAELSPTSLHVRFAWSLLGDRPPVPLLEFERVGR